MDGSRSTPTLADRLRTVAVQLPAQYQIDVLAVAHQVARLEAALDEQVAYARIDALAAPRIRRTRHTDPQPHPVTAPPGKAAP